MDIPCEASGYPEPVIVWTRGGNLLPSDRRHAILPAGTLHITRVATHDEGQYECEAVSPVGTVRATVQLNIEQRGEKLKGSDHSAHSTSALCRIIGVHAKEKSGLLRDLSNISLNLREIQLSFLSTLLTYQPLSFVQGLGFGKTLIQIQESFY